MDLWRGESLEAIDELLQAEFPTLRLVSENSRNIVRGGLQVMYQGAFVDGFSIEIRLDERDELGLPKVGEIGGRTPWTADRHVNPDGTACLFLPEDFLLRQSGPLGLREFIRGPVMSYFVGQSFREKTGAYPFGEWGHGRDGTQQRIRQLLHVDEPAKQLSFLRVLAKKTIKSHWPCPCGSRRRFGQCHAAALAVRSRYRLRWRRALLELARRRLSPA